jgi:hypothetical protein
MRRFVAVAATAALLMLSVGAGTASANNDPHRAFLLSAPFDLPGGTGGICAFPVHVAFPVNNEYGTTSYLPDGSPVLKVTGTSFMSVTNVDTLKMITVNVSAGGTFTYPLDGLTVIASFHGPGFMAATNLTSFGFPSNFVVAAGSGHLVASTTSLDFISVSGPLHVLTDVCAALS